MTELRRLKHRATIKSQITRINNTINENTSASEAKVKSKKIENLWEAFEQMQAKIDEGKLEEVGGIKVGGIEVSNESSISAEQEAEWQVFENIYFEVATKVQTILDIVQVQTQSINQAEIQVARVAAQAERQNAAGHQQKQDNSTIGYQTPYVETP